MCGTTTRHASSGGSTTRTVHARPLGKHTPTSSSKKSANIDRDLDGDTYFQSQHMPIDINITLYYKLAKFKTSNCSGQRNLPAPTTRPKDSVAGQGRRGGCHQVRVCFSGLFATIACGGFHCVAPVICVRLPLRTITTMPTEKLHTVSAVFQVYAHIFIMLSYMLT